MALRGRRMLHAQTGLGDPFETGTVEQHHPTAAVSHYHCNMVVRTPERDEDGTVAAQVALDRRDRLAASQARPEAQYEATADPKTRQFARTLDQRAAQLEPGILVHAVLEHGDQGFGLIEVLDAAHEKFFELNLRQLAMGPKDELDAV